MNEMITRKQNDWKTEVSPLTGAFVGRETFAKHVAAHNTNVLMQEAHKALFALRFSGTNVPQDVWDSITETMTVLNARIVR